VLHLVQTVFGQTAVSIRASCAFVQNECDIRIRRPRLPHITLFLNRNWRKNYFLLRGLATVTRAPLGKPRNKLDIRLRRPQLPHIILFLSQKREELFFPLRGLATVTRAPLGKPRNFFRFSASPTSITHSTNFWRKNSRKKFLKSAWSPLWVPRKPFSARSSARSENFGKLEVFPWSRPNCPQFLKKVASYWANTEPMNLHLWCRTDLIF
jgi:hypothetical protein